MQRKAGLRFFSNANLKAFIDNVLPRLLHSIKAQLDVHCPLAMHLESLAIGFKTPFTGSKSSPEAPPFRKAVSEVKIFGNSIVSKAVHTRQATNVASMNSKSPNPLRNDLINSLLDNEDNHQVVADAAMNYLSAGRDTTTQSLTWVFYMMMRHPKARMQVLEELRVSFNVGRDTGSLLTTATVSLDWVQAF